MTALRVADLNVEPDKLINWFDDLGTTNKYSFLSNFYVGELLDLGIQVRGSSPNGGPYVGRVTFHHGEGAFQALKATTFEELVSIAELAKPSEAKRAGRSVQLRPDWEQVKYDVMASVIRAKFNPGRAEADMLLQTGDAYLVEGTWWRDQVWGVDLNADDFYHGRNWLGTLLMARRAELRAFEDHGVVIPNGIVNLHFADFARPTRAQDPDQDGTLEFQEDQGEEPQ